MTEKSPRYLSGFGNEHATEALPGTLPQGQNAPQKPPHGLYTEQISGTPFTAPRGHNRRSWLYRIRPSAMHPAFHRIDNGLIRSAPFDEVAPPPIATRPSIKSLGWSGKGSGSHLRRLGGGATSSNGALRIRPLSIRWNAGCIADGRMR